MRTLYTLSLVLFAATVLVGQSNPLFYFEKSGDVGVGEDLSTFIQLAAPVGKLDFTQPFHLPVAGSEGVNVEFEEQASIHPFKGVKIYYARTNDARFGHLARYRDVVLVVNEAADALHLSYSTEQAEVNIHKTGDGYRFEQHGHSAVCPHGGKEPAFAEKSALVQNISPFCQEQDASGRYIMDVLFTYSLEAATKEQDLLGHAIAKAEQVNVALTNTLVENARIRVIDIAVKDNHIGVDSPGLATNPVLYAEEMDAVGADMIADFQDGKDGADNNFGGWASTYGFSSISYINGGTIFRHEWGHNMGSSHCRPNSIRPYSAGIDNGTQRTIMCGNGIPYFSNPDIDLGNGPIGADTANNARLIREYAPIRASRERHVIPYAAEDDGNCGTPAIAQERYQLQNVATGQYLGPTRFGARGNPLILVDDPDENENIWEVHHTGDGSAMLQNANTLRTVAADGSNDGTAIALDATTAEPEQRLLITPTGNGTWIIEFLFNGLVLRPNAATDGVDDPLLQAEATGTTLDEWRLITPPAGTGPSTSVVLLDLQAQNATCAGSTSGSVTANVTGGNGSYTYEWASGETTASLPNVGPGEYRVTVTSNFREYAAVARVMTKAPLIINGTTTRTVPGTKGGITIDNVTNANGTLTYAWSDGGNGAARTGLDAGDYTVTVTDADGCTDERIFRVDRDIDEAQQYLIQDVASGEYLGLSDEADPQRLLELNTCPSLDFGHTIEFRSEFAGSYIIRNSGRPSVYNVNDDGDLFASFLAGNNRQYFFFTWEDTDGDDLLRMGNRTGRLTVLPEEDGRSALSLQPVDSGPQLLRLVPVGDCGGTAGDACTDNNNSTDMDEISLLCDCCGQQTECFDVAGAAPNGDGDVDGDGVCVDDDCDDNDASLYKGALCDDGQAGNYGDALDEDCVCTGRPETCTETGDALTVVSTEGTASASTTLSSGASPDALTDGVIDGFFRNGTVWHSNGSFAYADVDLNTQQSIRELRVYPRTDAGLARMEGLYILISDVPFVGGSLADARALADYEYEVPSNYPGSQTLVLQPNVIGRYIRLKQSTTSPINLTEIEARSCPLERSLPVTLLDFTGRTLAKTNELTWRVADEEAFSHYTVERSADGGSDRWEAIGEVDGTSEELATYTFTDQVPLPSALYRLRMNDLDGTATYSPIVRLQRVEAAGLSIFPVPANETVTLRGLVPNSGEVTIYSSTGQVISTLTPRGEVSLSIDVREWPAGVYFVRDGAGALGRILVK